ncbi:MAG: NAD(P)/FAD-dependent oxidoreductase, partial [Muribaculaceae bacterium]|nr:NAD(P)/FAD-dependent oxidoreductase [Muribaculaceae bacterium]
QLRAIDDVMGEVITDPHLANVLVGNLPLYAGEKGKTPFATHAFIMNFYNQSSYRVVGGSDAIAKSLCKTLERYGGKVLLNHKATAIVCDDTHATGVEVNGSKMLPAHYVISDAHPIRTLELIDSKLIRPVFRRRVNEMPQTVGGFSVYLQFKENSVPYMNHNYYAYNGNMPWGCEHYDESSWPKGFLYMHFCHCHRPLFAKAGVVLSYMQMSDVEQWIGTKVGRRGNDYEAFKQRKAQQLIASLEKHFPGIGANIEHYYTSTPLTYLDYTGTAGGSMYGIAKDVTQGASGRVPHRMKVPNVFQTGQNINSHGILGVLVGTIVTCSEFLTSQKIYQQITSNQ